MVPDVPGLLDSGRLGCRGFYLNLEWEECSVIRGLCKRRKFVNCKKYKKCKFKYLLFKSNKRTLLFS